MRGTAVRFLVVGGLSFALDASTLFLLHGVLRLWLPAATALAFGVAFLVNFGLNRIWVFAAAGSAGRHFFRYVCLVAANLGLTVALVETVTWLGAPYLWAKTASTASLVVVNYVVSKKWVYAPAAAEAPVAPPVAPRPGPGRR